jgi:hypothetical protein
MLPLTPEIKERILFQIRREVDEINSYLERIGSKLRLRIVYGRSYDYVYVEAYEWNTGYSHGTFGYFMDIDELEKVIRNIRKFVYYLDRASR